jgi:glycosyltransferase involved in cell wall biosynthesis
VNAYVQDDRKITVVYNGVENELFTTENAHPSRVRDQLGLDKRFVYCYFGRPGVSKGLEYLIHAVPLITARIADAKLVLILSHHRQKMFHTLMNDIHQLGISDDVLVLDPVKRSELPSYVKAADCVVVPSLSEGFGLTAAEACALNVPVVASNAASLPEVVSGKFVLIQPESAEAIADGVVKMANGSVKHIEKKVFRWSDAVKQYDTVYHQLLEST